MESRKDGSRAAMVTQTKNRLADTVGEGEGRTTYTMYTEIYTLPYGN